MSFHDLEPPVIETERLLLRPPRGEDFAAYADYVADPVANAHIGGAQSRSMAWRTLCQYGGAWAMFGFSMFLVFERATGDLVGRVGCQHPEGWPGPEVGWGLKTSAQGRGLAAEAASAAMDFAVDRLGWTEITHAIAADNAPSQALARRLGSAPLREAMLPDPINRPVTVWGQSAEAWRGRRRPGGPV